MSGALEYEYLFRFQISAEPYYSDNISLYAFWVRTLMPHVCSTDYNPTYLLLIGKMKMPVKPISSCFVISVFLFAITFVMTSPVFGQELCPSAAYNSAVPAFNLFLEEQEDILKLQIKSAVCAGENQPASMPAKDDILSFFERSGTLPDTAQAQVEAYSCFGRLFITRVIELRVDMENCFAMDNCVNKLCADLKIDRQNKTEQSRSSATAPNPGSAQSLSVSPTVSGVADMREVYDRNAKDLMAIP